MPDTEIEYVDVLDEQGNPTGQIKSRDEVHRTGDWHRAVRVWILNSKNELLAQRRSAQKKTNPLKWTASATGHVTAGQNSLDAIVRELEEELGVPLPASEFQFLFTAHRRAVYHEGTFLENEIEDVYLVKHDHDLSLVRVQEEEVSEVKWISVDELRSAIENKSPDYVTSEEVYTKLFGHLEMYTQ